MKSIPRLLIAGCGAMLLLLSFSPAAFADQSDKTIASLTKAALKLPTSPFLANFRLADHTSAAARYGTSCQRGDIASESYNFGRMEVPMATAQPMDQAKQEAFVE